jgi:hypothetical protein
MIRVSLKEDKEVIYDAYQRALNNLRVQRHKNKEHVLHKRKIIKEKNKKYNTLHWKLFRMKQVMFGLDAEIKKLKVRHNTKKAEGRKLGYKEAMRKIDKIAFTPDNPYKFIAMLDLLSDTIRYSVKEISFILWANQFDFFTKKDFDRDLSKSEIPYYHMVSKFKRSNIVTIIGSKENRNVYSLTGIGKQMGIKINKYIKNI